MATIAQIKDIVNDIAKQTVAGQTVTVINTSTLVSLGDAIMGSDTDKDAFVHALSDRIGLTIESVRLYSPSTYNIVMYGIDYGLATQKIYVDLPDALENSSWQIGESNFTPVYAPVIKPNVKQKIFTGGSTFEIDMTVPDSILSTAFTSFEAMGAFINAIFVAIDNRIAIAIENCVELVIGTFIGRKLINNKGCGCINVLYGFNQTFGKNYSYNQAIFDKQFLTYLASQITLWCNRMAKMSTLFNDENYKRHTPAENLNLIMLADIDSNLSAFLEADTFNVEKLRISRYSVTPYWQGSGDKFAFNDVSKIDLAVSATQRITQTGIIGVAFDYEALGVQLNQRNITTERNNRSEYTNYYNKITRRYFNDMSENGIVFYMSESASPSVPTTPPTSITNLH